MSRPRLGGSRLGWFVCMGLLQVALIACTRAPERPRADDPVLEHRLEHQDARAAALKQRQLHRHARDLLPLVAAADIAPRGANDRLHPAVDVDIAQWLAASGFTADDLARHRRLGLDPVAAAVAGSAARRG